MEKANKVEVFVGIESGVSVSAAVLVAGRPVVAGETDSADHLSGLIKDLLARAGVDYDCIEGIAYSTGPGSATGLRIGASAALGLASAVGVEAVGIGLADAVSANRNANNQIGYVVVPARTGFIASRPGGDASEWKKLEPEDLDALTASGEIVAVIPSGGREFWANADKRGVRILEVLPAVLFADLAAGRRTDVR